MKVTTSTTVLLSVALANAAPAAEVTRKELWHEAQLERADLSDRGRGRGGSRGGRGVSGRGRGSFPRGGSVAARGGATMRGSSSGCADRGGSGSRGGRGRGGTPTQDARGGAPRGRSLP